MPTLTRMKELLGQHGDKVEKAVDKAAATIDRRTGGQHRSAIEKGARSVKQYVGGSGAPDARPTAPP